MTRRKTIITVLAVILGVLGFFGYVLWHSVHVTIFNAYAVWNTADHINDYMDAHQGAWPRNWSDLRKTYEGSGRFSPEHWANLEDRVQVDWNFEPRLLASAPEPTDQNRSLRVVWLKNDSHVHWSGAEPNRLIWNHWRRSTSRPSTRSSTSRAP